MKLNHDCVRSVLLVIEETATIGNFQSVEQLRKSDSLKEYSLEELTYTLLKLKEAEFIDASFTPPIQNGLYYFTSIGNLTYSGHEFLDNIRDPKVWKITKEKASQVGSFAISTLAAYAVQVGKDLLGLQ